MMFTDPNLTYTKELEDAMIASTHAVESRGLRIMLCRAADPADVAAKLLQHAEWVQPGNVPVGPPTPAAGYINALENLVLLANLLKEHVKAGNWHPDKMKAA